MSMTLQGRHLKVGAGIWVPWVDLHAKSDGALGYSGIIPAFFDDIAIGLNFTFSIHEPDDGEWGRELPNGSFTGLVGMCQRKEVDLVLGPLGISWDRFQVADFSIPLYVDQFGIFLPRPKLEKDLSNMTKPLALEVWIALSIILSISMVIALLMSYLMKQHITDEMTSDESRKFSAVSPSAIIRIISTETINHLPTSDAGRILLGTWMLGGLILQSAYSGVLTSLLAVPKVTVPVDSLLDLVDFGKIPWALERGTFLDHYTAKAKSGVYKKIRDKASFVPYVYVAKDRVKEEGLAVLADIFTMKKIMSEDYSATSHCNYYIAKKPIQSVSLAFGFPKGSKLIQHFNRWLGPIKESGVLKQIMQKVIDNATACMVKPGKEGGGTELIFSVVDLAGVFILLSGGALMGLALLVLEKSAYSVIPSRHQKVSQWQ